MINAAAILLLVVLSMSALLNNAHADDYRVSWKRQLLVISACSVVLIPRIAQENISIEMLMLLGAVTYQNVSMAWHSWCRVR